VLLIDNSAWARLPASGLAHARAQEVADALDRGEVLASVPFLLEAGYSARSADDHATLMKMLLVLPRAAIDEEAERRASKPTYASRASGWPLAAPCEWGGAFAVAVRGG